MRRIAHLARRFFGSFRARWPLPVDQSFVAELLSPAESHVFWDQPVPDLAHALRSAHAVLDILSGRSDLARAALLHDVGKRHSGIGTLKRSIATGLSALRIPTRGRMARYLDHAAIGAGELEDLGCEDLVVQFSRHHHGSRPTHLSAVDWSVLVQADDE